MKKKLLSMLLIAAMAVTLVACGTDEKPSKDNNDNKKPTNTVADATETPSGDPVTPYEPGASGPTNATTETPEPEKNVITLLSPDGSKVLHEFPIPDGYTVTSDKKSNHVVLEKDDDNTIKVELVSGPCAEVLSAEYQLINMDNRNSGILTYPYAGTFLFEGTQRDENTINSVIDEICSKSGMDKTYFTKSVENIRIPNSNKDYGFTYVVKYPEQYNANLVHEWDNYTAYTRPEPYYWDLSKHTDYSDYKITSYSYHFNAGGTQYLPADETFSVQITTTFDANKYNRKPTIEENIYDYISDVSDVNITDFLEDNFNMNTHTCEHCK